MKYFSVSQQWVLFVASLVLLASLLLRFYYYPSTVPCEEPAKEVVVEVLGEVRQPGIFLFQEPPSLGEVIDRAGGLKEIAPLDAISSSTILETGTLLTVARESSRFRPAPLCPPPLPQEQPQPTSQVEIKIKIGRMDANKLLVFSIPLDLNHVSLQDLCLISGIGESLAREIIAYRERRKGFRSVEELRKVRGIGEKKYETFKKALDVKR